MLQNFRFARYRFTYTVGEPLKMPRYKGNVFRARFGYILRHITCVSTTQECDTRCQFPERCIYSKCFETPVPADAPILRGQPYAPHPFVLEPPHTWQLRYAPGDTFACNLVLIGEAISLLPWLVYTFNEIGKRRIGLRGERGRCQLDKVESLPARDSLMSPESRDQEIAPTKPVENLPVRDSHLRTGDESPYYKRSRTIYTAETEMLTDEGLILRLDDVMHGAPHVTDEIELEFLTPTSIKVNGKWTSELTFEHLIRNLLRRIRFLSYFHCGEDLDVDAPGLIESSRSVKHESRLQWFRQDRWSRRTEKSIPMGGFVGNVRFIGALEPFLPFIYLGEYLHIGHHTAFGHGQYRLNSSGLTQN